MEDIIISLEPAFHRVERFILWHNRYASLLAFILGHAIFYAIARAGLRPFCAITLVVLIFHILDCLKQKRSRVIMNEETNFCELTQLVLRSYRYVCQTHERLNTLKTENRVKYSIIIIIICLILAFIGMKINGFYVSYLTMLILFTLPAIVYHKLIPKLIKRLTPLIEQLDQSMAYKRRSLLDRKELLVKLDEPGMNNDDDDEEVQRLKQQHNLLKQKQQKQQQEQQQQQIKLRKKRESLNLTDDEDEEIEHKLICTRDESQTILDFRKRYNNETDSLDVAVVPKQTTIGDSSFDMLSDSSSSTADDEANHISELYANMGDQFDGKHRIKIKGDELKIKGRSNKQRSKLLDAQFFQSVNDNDNNKPSAPILINSASNTPSGEPDLTSFDFLNDYDEKA